MKRTIKHKLSAIAIILIFTVIYYGFLFDIVLSVKDSTINIMQSHNLTTISYTIKEYNATSNTWDTVPKILDLAGLIDVIFTILIVFAPMIIIFYYIYD